MAERRGRVHCCGGDYNGDGIDEVAVYRPSDQTWYSTAGLDVLR